MCLIYVVNRRASEVNKQICLFLFKNHLIVAGETDGDHQSVSISSVKWRPHCTCGLRFHF